MEELSDGLVAAIAAELQRRAELEAGGAAVLAERKDLEPATVTALSQVFGERAQKSRQLKVPYWSNVGQVDLLVRESSPVDERVSMVAELKWCGPRHDILYEALWDMFKMALAAGRKERPAAYLIAGAEPALWEGSPFADLFDDGSHDPVELCLRRLCDRRQTLAWDDLLRGGYDRYPDRVPARISTALASRAPVGGWELRAVQVNPVGDDWIAMDGGWPHGDRPQEARHPRSQ